MLLHSKLGLPTYDPNNIETQGTLTAEQVADLLVVSMRTVRELLRTDCLLLVGTQVVKFAPRRLRQKP